MDSGLEELILRIVEGKATSKEAAFIEQWAKRSAENTADYENFKALLENVNEIENSNKGKEPTVEGWGKINLTINAIGSKRAKIRRWKKALSLFVLVLAALVSFLVIRGELQGGQVLLEPRTLPLKEVVVLIESKYPVKIEFENNDVLNCEFFGTISLHGTASDAIGAVAEVMGLRHRRLSKTDFLIEGSSCLD